jgi:AcrR family transcriptional regulator
VERISTNLAAARAGVSPPTLYHYFPDKYALLAPWGSG